MFVLAKIANQSFGRILVISQFSDEALRLNAIEAGAVDCVFVSDGVQSLLKAIEESADEFADYAIRELLPTLTKPEISKEEYQQVSVALDTLDEKEAKILKGFCELKTDAQISSAVHVPKLKVRQTLAKVQKLLLIDTRSQLLLKMFSLGALAL
jgi:DNA-binding NarL/FixJ family response regulator